MHNLTVVNDVIFALQTQQTPVARLCKAAGVNQVLIGNDFRANKSPLNVGMDFSRRVERRHALTDGPGTALVFSDREE